jgi:hypothetical protein
MQLFEEVDWMKTIIVVVDVIVVGIDGLVVVAYLQRETLTILIVEVGFELVEEAIASKPCVDTTFGDDIE